jgi:CSLREA domain-containing protein
MSRGTFRTWLGQLHRQASLTTSGKQKKRGKRARCKARRRSLEGLEDRNLLSTVTAKLVDLEYGFGDEPEFTEVGDAVFFAGGYDGVADLWKTDGTPGGTAKLVTVADTELDPMYARIGDLVNANGTLAFVAADDDTVQLWKSDGTTAGTVLVHDFGTKLPTGYGSYLTAVGGSVFGVLRDPSDVFQLFYSDLSSGADIVKEFDPLYGFPPPSDLLDFNGKLYFAADDGTHGTELWVSDGTPSGTAMVMDIKGSAPSYFYNYGSYPTDLTAGDGVFYFGVLDFGGDGPGNGNDSIELWQSDGTTTESVYDEFPAGTTPPGSLYGDPELTFVPETGKLYGVLEFEDDGVYSRDLICWDGSTMHHWNFNEGGDDMVGNLSPAMGLLGFGANDGVHGREPFLSNGTSAGAGIIKDINNDYDDSSLEDPSYSDASFPWVENGIYFAADDGVHGTELWRSTGSEATTQQVADINNGGSSYPRYLTAALGKLFFVADDDKGPAVWAMDPNAPEPPPPSVLPLFRPGFLGVVISDDDGDIFQVVVDYEDVSSSDLVHLGRLTGPTWWYANLDVRDIAYSFTGDRFYGVGDDVDTYPYTPTGWPSLLVSADVDVVTPPANGEIGFDILGALLNPEQFMYDTHLPIWANALAMNPVDGKLYAAGAHMEEEEEGHPPSADNFAIYEVDVAGAADYEVPTTPIVDLGTYQSAGDIAFDDDGYLYLTTTNNKLLRVDVLSATPRIVGEVVTDTGYGDFEGLTPSLDETGFIGFRQTATVYAFDADAGTSGQIGSQALTHAELDLLSGATVASMDPVHVTSPIDGRQLLGQQPTLGQLWYEFDADNNGDLSIELIGGGTLTGDASLTLYGYGSGDELVELDFGTAQVSINDAAAGAAYVLHVQELTEDADFEFVNGSAVDPPPRITRIDELPDAGGVIPVDTVSSLTVHFSEEMQEATVEDSGNWQLIEAGANGAFDDGDDVAYSFSGITYDVGQARATLVINGGPLPFGRYRLTADGDSTLLDAAGIPLDGNSDGTGGDDYVTQFVVSFRFGIVGDSLTDEYVDQGFPYAETWAELLADDRVYLGEYRNPTTWPDVREVGYEYNWAQAGATSGSLLSDGQHTGLAAQVTTGDVSHAVLAIGQNDYWPEDAAYVGIYSGTWSQAQIDAHNQGIVTNIDIALATLTATDVNLVMSNVIDYGVAPTVRSMATDPVGRQRVADAVSELNVQLEALATQYQIPLVDSYGLTKAYLGEHGSEVASSEIGGVTILNQAGIDAHNAFVNDGIHPHSVLQSVFANCFIEALNLGYSAGLDLYSELEMLTKAGIGDEYTGDTLAIDYSDYVILPQAPSEYDFGDAPDPTYPTLLASDGARHGIEAGFHLGNTIDSEADGQPDLHALGDDLDGNVDDDGVSYVGWPEFPGTSGNITVTVTDTAGTGGYLDAWMDFNRDGDWDDPGEQIVTNLPVVHGDNTFPLTLPANAVPGYAAARFRLSRDGNLSYSGLAYDGEVEDYMKLIKKEGMDFGDAPDGPYPTFSASVGAVHSLGSQYYLGASVDHEYDGQPDPQALGDDNDGSDDEDGVRLLTRIVPGTTAWVEVTASAAGYLNAWLDLNADGDWDDPGEHFAADLALVAGANQVPLVVPASALVTPSTFARFRFSSQAGLDYRGWAPDGEVEDYEVAIHAVRQWVVDSTGDGGDANIGDGICDDGSGACTLRAAIQEANALANLPSGSDGIVFAIPGPGTHPIQPASALPAITDPVVIDATTQPGYAGTPLIELDGSLAGAGVSGLRFETGGNTVKGLAINRFAASGILVLTGGENTIQGNFLGTDATGTAAAPNAASGIDVRTAGNLIGGAGSGEGNLISGNTNFGILLLGGAAENTIVGNRIGTDQTGTAAIGNALYGIYVTSPGNQIGGPAAGDGNLISGNLRGGVAVTGATATGNVVRGNRVGTMADGNAALPNGNAGITVSNVSGNTIGGTAAGAGNVLSGNALHGAMIVGAASTNNVVQGNLVGLNAAGTAAVPNGQYGITNYSPDSRIGGPAAGAGNTVSGNNFSGVLVYTPTATGVKVQGNRIGTNAAGTAAVPNGFYGVYVNSTDNLIGGAAAGEGNLISGNTRGGVALTERTAQRNVVQGNRIGTNPAGTAALANGGSGVTIAEGSNNTIGGTAAGAGNQISGNAAQGVIVVGVNATGNTVRGNLIGTNGAGTAAVANGQYGVAVYSSNTTIGGAGSGNTISGNASGGVIVYGTTVTGTTVQGNRMGTDATGSVALPNGGYGLFVVASNSLIGGSVAGEGNMIAWNTGSGVYIAGETSTGNTIRQNSIFKNGLWGIDLAPWGPTANDPEDADTGTNNGQNFPELASAVLSGGTLNITYSVPSSTANSAYPLAVEFFLADADGQEGQTYLGGESYPAPGSDSVALTVSGLSAGQRVVATATDANGNTSEFSSSVVVAAALLAPETMDGATSATLDAESLTPVVWQAIAAWELAGLDAVRVASLHTVTFEIADLPGRYLAWATPDRIVLDIDAAGYGWYVASEAGSVADGFGSSDSQSQMDLLTAVLHEMGHVLGLADLEDEDDELMSSVLQPGTRQLPTAADIDRILANPDW